MPTHDCNYLGEGRLKLPSRTNSLSFLKFSEYYQPVCNIESLLYKANLCKKKCLNSLSMCEIKTRYHLKYCTHV